MRLYYSSRWLSWRNYFVALLQGTVLLVFALFARQHEFMTQSARVFQHMRPVMVSWECHHPGVVPSASTSQTSHLSCDHVPSASTKYVRRGRGWCAHLRHSPVTVEWNCGARPQASFSTACSGPEKMPRDTGHVGAWFEFPAGLRSTPLATRNNEGGPVGLVIQPQVATLVLRPEELRFSATVLSAKYLVGIHPFRVAPGEPVKILLICLH
ncbi:hypothetical protein L209DRAFT_531261 [Thermothelomyces heterothallicus CBS 203.75]